MRADNGIDYAYRDPHPGELSGVPLILLQRFRGNLDHWDPALVDALAADRRVLGFSIGSFVSQQVALVRPALVLRLILASAAPQGADGMHGWAPEVIAAVRKLGEPRPHGDPITGR